MKINSDLLINSKVNGIFYANDFKCKNLCDGKFESGNISDTGVETSSTSTYRSKNYYEIEGGETYICSYTATSGTNLNWAACYTENKTFITRLTGLAKSPFKVPSNTKYVRLGFYKASGISSSDFSNVQLEYGSIITPYTPYKAFENDETLKDVQAYTNDGIYWNKAINYETAADVPQWYELITLTLNPKKTGVYLINYSIPVLAKAGGTPFLDFQLDGARKHRAYISNVSSYTSMNAMAMTGSFTLSGINLNQNHSLIIGVSKNNSVGYEVNSGYPITVTAVEV